MLRGNHRDKVLVSNLRERGPDGHRGTWGDPGVFLASVSRELWPLSNLRLQI